MKSLISALVISVASVLPATAASIHDFNAANAAPTTTRTKARVGAGLGWLNAGIEGAEAGRTEGTEVTSDEISDFINV